VNPARRPMEGEFTREIAPGSPGQASEQFGQISVAQRSRSVSPDRLSSARTVARSFTSGSLGKMNTSGKDSEEHERTLLRARAETFSSRTVRPVGHPPGSLSI
jgi:hypothetical protein